MRKYVESKLDEITESKNNAVARIKELQSKTKNTFDELKEIGSLHNKITMMEGMVMAYNDILEHCKE